MENAFNKKLFCVAFILSSLLCFFGRRVAAQTYVANDVYIAKTFHNASGLPNNSHTFINSFAYTKKMNGKKRWHQAYHFPIFGINFLYGHFQNTKELGSQFSLVPHFTFKSHAEKRAGAFLTLGVGIGYFTKPYDRLSNPRNFYIGSSITNTTYLNFGTFINLSSKWTTTFSVFPMHSSNGHYQLPNLGLNMVGIGIGLKYQIKTSSVFLCRDSVFQQKRNWNNTLKFGLGIHEFGSFAKPTGGPKYSTFQLSDYFSFAYKQRSRIQIGINFGYYEDYYSYILNQQVFVKNNQLHASTLAVFAGNEFILGQFGLCWQAGIYLYNPFYKFIAKVRQEQGKVGRFLNSYNSNRLGINYYPFKRCNTLNQFSNQLNIGVHIKTNFGQADFFEYAVGYTF